MSTNVPQLSGLNQLIEQQKRMQKTFEPFALRLQALQTPTLELQRQLQAAVRPLTMFHENMFASIQPILDQQAQIHKSFEPFRRQLQAMQLPSLELQKQVQLAIKPIAKIQTNMLAGLEPLFEQHAQFQKTFEPLTNRLAKLPLREIELSLRQLSEVSDDSATIEYLSDDQDGFNVNGAFVSTEEVKSDLSKILKKQNETDLKLNNIFHEIGKLKGKTKDIIIALLVSFMFFILSTYNPLEYKANLHEVKTVANQIELSIEQKQHLRYVYVKTVLHVREDAYIHSEIVDFLPPGTVIILLQKNKTWSYVSYRNPMTGENESGWVFSRYVKKFR